MNFKKIALVAALPMVALAAPAHAKPGDKIAGSYICVFKNDAVSRGAVESEARRAANANGAGDVLWQPGANR